MRGVMVEQVPPSPPAGEASFPYQAVNLAPSPSRPYMERVPFNEANRRPTGRDVYPEITQKPKLLSEPKCETISSVSDPSENIPPEVIEDLFYQTLQ